MPPPNSIHILGIGNLGKLLAHSLRKSHPEIPITLLFHRPTLEKEWEEAGKSIEIVRNGQADYQNGFSFENIGRHDSKIDNLIVATKTHSTVQALRPLKERLGPLSTMLFLQNGIGTIDEVTTNLFTQPSSRPYYLAGIFNHGVFANSQFSSTHIGLASAFIGPVFPNTQDSPTPPDSEQPPTGFLAHSIAECPELTVSLLNSQEITFIQLQKLSVNAVINPLTAIFDVYNGELFQSAPIRNLMDRLISELSAVILAVIKSRLPKGSQAFDNVRERFSVEKLKENVYKVGEQTSRNISSMRQDVLAGRKTEIDYINGYIVDKGRRHGIDCPVNERIVELVKEKRKVSEGGIGDLFG